MDATLRFLVFPLAGYLLGSFPTGVVLTRRKYGIDVREMGSGNIGATNVTRVFGWYAGVLVFLVDIAKGALPLFLLQRSYPGAAWLLTVVGIAIVLGHCYSAYLGFRGGKGVATSLGCLCVVVPWVAGAAALVYVGLLAVTRISALGSLGGIAAILTYAALFRPPFPIVVLIAVSSMIVLVRHRSNIERLWADLKKKEPT